MKKEEEHRRSFLKHILAGSAAVIGAASIVKSSKAKSGPSVTQENEILYRETESFKKYYKSLR